ncbi:MAG: hypothetical protein J4F30_06035 [Acidobacteria bacterium]|nr:hypothetical protein [Acidobacteriota bacterium]
MYTHKRNRCCVRTRTTAASETTPGTMSHGRCAYTGISRERAPAGRRRPMLLIPPWMNMFCVMDLRPGNSMVE